MSFLGRIKESLARTKQQIVERFDDIVRLADEPERRSRPIDVDTVEALEELLISADIGVAATDRIIKAVTSTTASLALGARHDVELPIATQMAEVLAGRSDVRTAVEALMVRRQRAEAETG